VGSLERDFDGERIALNWAIDELDVEFVVRRWSSASGKRRLVARGNSGSGRREIPGVL
jgi:hypothetical protein